MDVTTKPFATPSLERAGVAPVIDEHTLDLANPQNIMLAAPHQLRQMEVEIRHNLLSRMTLEHLLAIDATRLAAINPLNKVVPFRGDEEPIEVRKYPTWIQGACKVVKMKPHSRDRFYLHFRGCGFTGVVRGTEVSKEVAAPTVAHAGGQIMELRADAEFAWLTGFYAGVCGKVIKKVLKPEIPEYA
jgi:hypothetical protein